MKATACLPIRAERSFLLLTATYSQLVLYFAVYSFIGWFCESVWCLVADKKWVNRGFLTGPFCPIYGFGAILILAVSLPLRGYPILVYLYATVAASLVEYFTGWLLETLFQMRWWDYSQRRFNIKGRVCLGNSLLFGVMGLTVTYLIHPLVNRAVDVIPPDWQRLVSTLLVALLALDLLKTLANLTNLKQRLIDTRDTLAELHNYDLAYNWYNKEDIGGSLAHLEGILAANSNDPQAALLLERVNTIQEKYANSGGRRLVKAFPDLNQRDWQEEFAIVRQNWTARGASFPARARSYWDEQLAAFKERAAITYKDITISRLVWIFFIGCLVGYVVETLFCLVVTGSIESRQGMVYGPFSQIYGFGAVLLVLVLAPFARRGNAWLFVGSALVGGVYEALCSYIQEMIFGTVSWEYSEKHLGIFGGRSSLIYMLFWGVLGILYFRSIYPRIDRIFTKLARRQQRFFAAVVAIVLGADLLFSALAVGRWVARDDGVAPANAIERMVDERFPDERMEDIYPNMVFK